MIDLKNFYLENKRNKIMDVSFVNVRGYSVSQEKGTYWTISVVAQCPFLWLMFRNEKRLILFLIVSKYF